MGEDRSDFGTKLRDARERKGVTLRQIANRTKISMTILEALERNDVTRLPGGIFSRSFVRSYAREVGLDPDTTIQEFVAQFPQDAVPAGHLRTDQVEDTELFESDRRVASSVLWILLVSIPLAGGVLYFSVSDRLSREPAGRVSGQEATPLAGESPGSADAVRSASTAGSTPSRGTSPPTPGRSNAAPSGLLRTVAPAASPARGSAPSPAAGSKPSPAGNTAGSPPAGSPTLPPAGAAAPTPVASTGTTAGSPAPADDRLTIVLAARRPVWISATADGEKKIGRLLQTGEEATVEVKRELALTAGDAAAVKMTVNGAEAKSLGKSGEVVTAHVTLANFKNYLQSP